MDKRSNNSAGVNAMRRWTLPLVAVLLLGMGVGTLASIGDHDPLAGIAAVVETALGPGLIALLWLAGAIGLGVWIIQSSWTLGACVGVGVMLFLAHLLGVVGALSGRFSQIVALAPPAIGTGLLIWRWVRRPPPPAATHGVGVSPIVLVAIPALSVLIVAAGLPAGTIWGSEANGYDVLSYHLQLVSEWRAGGAIKPTHHNVYSYLPSYVEASFAHLDAMINGPSVGGPGRGTGPSMLAAQYLHAMFAVLAAVSTGRLALSMMQRLGITHRAHGAMLTTVFAVSVPWMIVTGSMAYNEMGMLAMFAGALIGVFIPDVRPLFRGAIIGGMCGVAVSCKLTAAFMCVPTVVLVILWFRPRREWSAVFAGATAAGAFVIAPWLLRNSIHGGNPVFPFATGTFGAAHWTGEQAARWSTAHSADAGLGGRIVQLFSTGRGLLHPQWSIFAIVMLAGVAVSIVRRGTRRAGAVLLAMITVIVAAWLALGHQQSRFLLPIVVPGTAAIGLAIGTMDGTRWRMIARGFGAIGASAMGVHAGAIFAGQNGGHPNLFLIDGAAWLNGSIVIENWADLTPRDRKLARERMSPVALTNLALRPLPDAKVYLLGDATPLYYSVPVAYHTTWDASPIGSALRDERDPIAGLRAMGVTHMHINFAELERLTDRGWYDPDVTPMVVRDAILPRCEVVRGWPDLGVVLVRIRADSNDNTRG